MSPQPKPALLLMGQTPPPWHGQAVATQLLFDHDWPGYEVHRLRMEFSEEMLDVGRFQWKKIRHLYQLILKARVILKAHPGCILFYPPASAKWIPFLRDLVFLSCVRHLAGSTVFIFHASGLPVFVQSGRFRRRLGGKIYRNAEVSLEVAQEVIPPHEVFTAKSWQWCPCAIEVPERVRAPRDPNAPLTVLYVGSLQEGKGILEILKTASLLQQQGRTNDFCFRIVGKWFATEFESAAQQMHADLHLGDMVEFAGQLTGDKKWQAYATADVFFFPTHYANEATPIVLMEALGAGLPIVSTLWAGIPAMLNGCSTATLLPVREPTQYAAALAELFARRNQQDQTQQEARAFYRSNFLPERFIERVDKAFAAALMTQTRGEPAPAQSRTSGTPASINIEIYLADQNPGYDRSFGISRMSHGVIEALQAGGQVSISTIASKTSQQAPASVDSVRILPWGTRGKLVRLLTDHFHPLFGSNGFAADLHYFPKGYMPLLRCYCKPSVVTIHDTIIQYDEDHYPRWRKSWEYAYWALMLKHTLRRADAILTVSESSKKQIQDFMDRHGIPRKEITVTYEPCLYERVPQPLVPAKENYVIHLASYEPHKRTAQLIRWWHDAEKLGRPLPILHLIGTIPPEALPYLASSQTIVKRPFLEDHALQAAYQSARALILPSEIEGFGLPALEAYYMGTPVCFIRGTSVEEILSVATAKGGFTLDHAASLWSAMNEVMGMSHAEIRQCGLKLRETYASDKVANRMVEVFRRVAQ